VPEPERNDAAAREKRGPAARNRRHLRNRRRSSGAFRAMRTAFRPYEWKHGSADRSGIAAADGGTSVAVPEEENKRMEYSCDTLKCSFDGGVALVAINRPEALNALNGKVFMELGGVFEEMGRDDRVRAVVLTGEGDRAFAAGSDITEMRRYSVLEAREFAGAANRTQEKIETFEKPVIAAINGFALGGGCELAMACDIRIASDNAKFGQPEINLGLIPGAGGTQRLARLIGLGRAKELVYSGKIIDAARAYEWGLVNRVVPQAELIGEAMKLASVIAGKSLPILALAKEAFNNGFNLDLDRALRLEIGCFAACFGTEDHREGMLAFAEKRKPAFKDR